MINCIVVVKGKENTHRSGKKKVKKARKKGDKMVTLKINPMPTL